MTELPKLTLTLALPDPEWKAVFTNGTPHAINSDSYLKKYEVEVEVVQLNINSGGMRVRFPWPSKRNKKGFEMLTQDVSIEYFYTQYEIVKKG